MTKVAHIKYFRCFNIPTLISYIFYHAIIFKICHSWCQNRHKHIYGALCRGESGFECQYGAIAITTAHKPKVLHLTIANFFFFFNHSLSTNYLSFRTVPMLLMLPRCSHNYEHLATPHKSPLRLIWKHYGYTIMFKIALIIKWSQSSINDMNSPFRLFRSTGHGLNTGLKSLVFRSQESSEIWASNSLVFGGFWYLDSQYSGNNRTKIKIAKPLLSTSSLIRPSYPLSATIKKCFFPKKYPV